MVLDDSYTLFKVDSDTVFKPFDCSDDDLNDFLLNKSVEYAKEHLATTFVIENDDITVAYYSIFNDSVNTQQIDFASKSAALRFLKKKPFFHRAFFNRFFKYIFIVILD
mgnify:CR=1 FL=1